VNVTVGEDRPRAEEVLDTLREQSGRRPGLLFRGFGPLVVVVLLVVAMLLLLPSVAPERIVSRPVTTTEPGR
jgi:hypothetical protein